MGATKGGFQGLVLFEASVIRSASLTVGIGMRRNSGRSLLVTGRTERQTRRLGGLTLQEASDVKETRGQKCCSGDLALQGETAFSLGFS
jgi:hypothetical protein